MDFLPIIQSQYAAIIAGGTGGVITAWVTQRVLKRRGIFTYSVNHLRIGVSTEDQIFGKVEVSWNEKPIANLYLSDIMLRNESMNDYENVIVRAYTGDTILLSEQTKIVDTPNHLKWSENYTAQLHIEPGQTPTEAQHEIYNKQREYIIPVMNRGQKVKITYLNSADGEDMPSIWLSVSMKGVNLKFRGPQNEILGVPQNRAAVAGVIIGVVVVITLVFLVSIPWVVATIAFTYGLIAQFPGAYAVKLLRKMKEAIGG